jgi:hypothetical protein
MSAERFTLQIQGKGVRIKARIPSWMVAPILQFVKSYSAPEGEA